jgi:CheY-like chemotaxis protein
MAPEAIANVTAAGEGALVDLYGLGVVGYEMLTGRLPRPGIELGSLTEVLAPFAAPCELRDDVPPDLETLLLAMLETDPGARPSTAEEIEWRIRAMRGSGKALAGVMPTVLVVDDNREVSRVLGYCAAKELGECDIHYAVDGEEALQKVRELEPTIMLLDLEMPRVNGLEVAMYMRGARLAERCAVIAVSAGARESDLHALRVLGVQHMVLKDEHMRANLSALAYDVRRSGAAPRGYQSGAMLAPPLHERLGAVNSRNGRCLLGLCRRTRCPERGGLGAGAGRTDLGRAVPRAGKRGLRVWENGGPR